ncbi:MAG: hypothetical protein COB83_00465 [Gammaproteobacteria bacterium]|nr:MAG: hypothetical protein COB83_00465 [Gammaproteobacteria bacterium]
MRLTLFLVALISYSSLVLSTTVSSSRDSLNGEFSFSEGNLLQTKIKADFGQIDNFLRSNENEQKTNFLALSPELFIQTQSDGSLFQLQAKASYLTFDEFSSDDHYNFSVLSKYHLRFTESQKIFLTGFITDNYEYRGTGLSLGRPNSLTEGDTKRDQFFNVGYLYGNQDSLARANVLAGYRGFAYTTRKNITESLAYSSNYLQGNFDYLISGKTYFSTKIQSEDFSYDLNADLERKQYLALAGVQWQSTELTQLHILLGYEKAIFTNKIFENNNRFAWQINMSWNPLQRIRFNFNSGSEIKDSYRIVKSVSFASYYGLGLSYDFTQSLIFEAKGKYVDEDIVGIDNKIKEEHFETTIRLQYQWRHWLSVFAQYNIDNFDSTIDINSYDLQVTSLGVVVTFN